MRFTYNENGLLEVLATVIATQKTEQLVITQNAGSMSKKEIKQASKSLAKLKVHPRDQDENAALLNRTLRLYDEFIGFERKVIGSWIDHACRPHRSSRAEAW